MPRLFAALGLIAFTTALAAAPADQSGRPSIDPPGRQKSVRPQAPTVVAVRHTSKRPALV